MIHKRVPLRILLLLVTPSIRRVRLSWPDFDLTQFQTCVRKRKIDANPPRQEAVFQPGEE